MDTNFSVVISAYNEEDTIENVVRPCCEYAGDAEVIVVDDGSDDGTASILQCLQNDLDFRNIRLPANKGKSYAMVTGVEEANNEIIVFFDADVTGIKEVHFEKLIMPLIDEGLHADLVLGLPSVTLISPRYNPFNPLTGERALFKKDILPVLDEMRGIGFGIETYINLYYHSHGKKIFYTILEDLVHPTKYKKTYPGRATIEFIAAGYQIAGVLVRNPDLIAKSVGNMLNEKTKDITEYYRRIQDVQKRPNRGSPSEQPEKES